LFDGEDALGWTSFIERYFDLMCVGGGLQSKKRFRLLWWPWKAKPSHGIGGGNFVLQTGSVEEYRTQLELYAGLLRTAEPEYLKSIYLLMLSKTR
jgi:hypothetical protein